MIHNFTTGYILKNSENRNLTRNCKFVFITALLPMAKRQRPPTYPTIDEGKNKIYYMN